MASETTTPLDEYMRDHGLTNQQVADAMQVSAEAVRKWRVGKNRIGAEVAVRLSEQFGIERESLRPDLWPIKRTRRPSIPAQL